LGKGIAELSGWVGFANEAEQLGAHPQLKTSFEVASCSVDIELDAEMLAGFWRIAWGCAS